MKVNPVNGVQNSYQPKYRRLGKYKQHGRDSLELSKECTDTMRSEFYSRLKERFYAAVDRVAEGLADVLAVFVPQKGAHIDVLIDDPITVPVMYNRKLERMLAHTFNNIYNTRAETLEEDAEKALKLIKIKELMQPLR